MFLEAFQPEDGIDTRDAEPMQSCQCSDGVLVWVGHELVVDQATHLIRDGCWRLEGRVQWERLFRRELTRSGGYVGTDSTVTLPPSQFRGR